MMSLLFGFCIIWGLLVIIDHKLYIRKMEVKLLETRREENAVADKAYQELLVQIKARALTKKNNVINIK